MKVALVTGASRGLGAAVAAALASRGYALAVNHRDSEREAAELCRTIGTDCILFQADVSDAASVRDMVAAVETRFGRLDAVVSNAGISRDGLLLRQTEEEWDRVIGVNLTGCFNVIRAAAGLMIQSGGGHIVVISSRSGARGAAGQAAYSAAKAGLLGLTRSAAAELAPHGILVNAVLPGYMMTAMGAAAPAAAAGAQEASLLKRPSDPDEAAAFIVCLIGMQGVTGQVFSIDSRPG